MAVFWFGKKTGKNYDKEIKQINDNLNELGNDLNDLDSVAAKRNEINVFQKQLDMKDRLVFKPENTLNTKDLIRLNLETFTYDANKYIDYLSITRGSTYLFKWRIGMDANGINNTSWQSDITHNFVLPVGFNGSETKFYRGFNSVGNVKLWRITELGQDTGTEAYILPRKDTGKSTLKLGNSTKNDDKRYDINLENRSRILNALDPVADGEVANKRYVDNAVANIPSGIINISNNEILTNLQYNGSNVYVKNISISMRLSSVLSSVDLMTNISDVIDIYESWTSDSYLIYPKYIYSGNAISTTGITYFTTIENNTLKLYGKTTGDTNLAYNIIVYYTKA